MAKRMSSNAIDLTQGTPYKQIILFSLPLLAGNMLQQLYNMVDSVVVGRFVGDTALAAVGLAFPVIFMMSSLFSGLGGGAMIMVSQYHGGDEPDNLKKTIDTVYTALMVGIVPLTLLGILFARPLMGLLNVPADVWDEAYLYIVIIMGGLIGSLGYNANAGILQGLGDSKTPLIFLALSCGLNIVADLFFVVVIPLGVAGVAIATIGAQLFSWIFGIIYINKKYEGIHIHPFSFRFDREIFGKIMKLGIPAGIQQALFSVGTLVLTRLVNGYGSAFAAGYNAANKLDTFAFLPIQSISIAIVAYVGQNIGAGKLDRVKAGVTASLVLTLIFSALGLLLIPFGPACMRLFSDSPEVIAAGMAYLNRIMPFYFMLGLLFVFNGVLRGAGEAMVPMVSSAISLWLARLPAAYIFAARFGRDSINFCFAAGWAIGLLITVPYYLSGRWKNKALTRAGTAVQIDSASTPPSADA